MEEEIKNVNPDSLLVVNEKGVLKRLKCPFKGLLIIAVDNLRLDQIYSIQAVLMDQEMIMVYYIQGTPYYYYYFAILD